MSLGGYGIQPKVVDPLVDARDAIRESTALHYRTFWKCNADCIIIAVAQNEFRQLTLGELKQRFKSIIPDSEKVLGYIKGLSSITDLQVSGIRFWRL